MSSLPKMRTQEDVTRENVEKLQNGSERVKALTLLGAMFGHEYKNLPTTDDHDKIAREALSDFRQSNFSEAASAVDSLVKIVDFYKELAESFHADLTKFGAVVDEHGSITTEPFVIVDPHNQVLLGKVEVIEYEEQDMLSLWEHYVKPYLPIATEREHNWIAAKFAEQIFKEEEAN